MKRKISFQKLINIYDYDLGTQLHVFQWMIKTGWAYQENAYWGDAGVFEMLYGLNSLGGQSYNFQYGFSCADKLSAQLKTSFVRAIVADDVRDCVKKWRSDERIGLDRYRMLEMPENRLDTADLWRLFKLAEKPLTTQLNSFHPAARHIRYVLLTPNREGWQVKLHYGYDDSIWRHDLIERRMPIHEAVPLALQALEALTAARE